MMSLKTLYVYVLFFLNFCFISIYTQIKTYHVSKIFPYYQGQSKIVDDVFKNYPKHRLQIIITTINRNRNSNVSFVTKNYTSHQYLYPASLVKLPIALLTIEKLESLNIPLYAELNMMDDMQCKYFNPTFYFQDKKKTLIA